ncbi:hypothetical protein SFUMM280S_10682 [Streptomyces fumanus]
MVLPVRVRRFFCPESSCARRTFAEQMPGPTRRHSRWTERLPATLAAVGLALAGWPGARMQAFGVAISRSAVLRLLNASPETNVPARRVVGVGEYATREGRVYGTVLVDVETCRPVDMRPDREASSLAAWLVKRPGIEIVCRDRAPFFALGATAGAPQATQVADRWHLWHNLGEAAERAVARHRQCLCVLVPDREGKVDEPAPSEEKADSHGGGSGSTVRRRRVRQRPSETRRRYMTWCSEPSSARTRSRSPAPGPLQTATASAHAPYRYLYPFPRGRPTTRRDLSPRLSRGKTCRRPGWLCPHRLTCRRTASFGCGGSAAPTEGRGTRVRSTRRVVPGAGCRVPGRPGCRVSPRGR